jgi:septal ring factor EnvC (AmiA/AmiB activator)
LDFEPLLEFLKHGLFDIYVAGHMEGGDSAVQMIDTDGSVRKPSAPLHFSDRASSIPKGAIDDLVKDAMSIRVVTRKKLSALKKEYEDELKQSDPTYLAEKSLETQNQRLQMELKRSERMLDALNKDHVDLAGQMVTLRVEVSKEKEVSDQLRRQVAELKSILKADMNKLNHDEVNVVLNHEVTPDNANLPLPEVKMDAARMPSLEEQIAILTQQNVKLLEEAQFWRSKAESLGDLKSSQSSSTTTSTEQQQASWLEWRKKFMTPTS